MKADGLTNAERHVLGPLCKRGHDHDGTGQSLRYVSTRQCIVCHAEWRRRYDAQNREKVNALARVSYHRHRDSILSRQARYRLTKAFKASQRASRLKHRDKRNAEVRTWKAANPDRVRLMDVRRRARERVGRGGHYTADDLAARFGAFEGGCAYCGAPATTRDHVIPIGAGGPDTLDNLVPACRSCNLSKAARPFDEWLREQPSFTEERLETIVAVTRAQRELIFLTSPKPKKDRDEE